MAGIYIHIPFCRQACHYCDFHFSTQLQNRPSFLNALKKEIELRQDYVSKEKIRTIYFGGGTPSLLEGDELKAVLGWIHEFHDIDPGSEITLEANPDDLDKKKIRDLFDAGINRLSIGIQSFRDEDLKWMNRAHNSSQADYAVKASQDIGFENITIDLMYSIPDLDLQSWKKNLASAIDLDIQHISAYSMTIEPRTVFGVKQAKGLLHPVDDSISHDQFLMMVEELKSAGIVQYEVSNFSKEGYESKHNSAYWKGEKYIGLGPSAHSFDGSSRQWNVSNNALYISELENGRLKFEREVLNDQTIFNEYIMTRLRTVWGIELPYISKRFGIDIVKSNIDYLSSLQKEGKLTMDENNIVLTSEGLLFADRIASELFVIE